MSKASKQFQAFTGKDGRRVILNRKAIAYVEHSSAGRQVVVNRKGVAILARTPAGHLPIDQVEAWLVS